MPRDLGVQVLRELVPLEPVIARVHLAIVPDAAVDGGGISGDRPRYKDAR